MRKLISGIAVLALAGAAGACDRDLTGINENPNSPTDVPAEYLLPQSIQSGVSLVLGAGLHMNYTALWAQHFAQIQYPDEDRYRFRQGATDGIWTGFYANALKDADRLVEKGEETGNPNHRGVGLVMKSWLFSVATDLWGDIPYTDALSADKEGGTLTPAYDRQEDIYAGMLQDLTTAAQILDANASGFGSSDLIYGGDVEAWRKFANSLRMRLAMRLVNVDPAKARQEFEAAVAAGGFESNDDLAQLQYLASAPNQNPMHVNWRGRDDHAVSKTLVDMLLDLNDPRLTVFAEPNASDGEYVGMPNGMAEGHGIQLSTISRIGNTWREQPDGPAVLMSYAEVLFLRAEAAQRGWNAGGSAEELYEQAIRASLAQYGFGEAEADAYLAQADVAFDAAGSSPLRQIGIQKWIALFNNGPEAFAEWRRTGYPELTPGPFADFEEVIRRVPYPTGESSMNGANLEAAISAQGYADPWDRLGRVWWDRP